MIPPTVHLCWAQGEEQAPNIVKFCIQMWRELNPDADIKVYDDKDINRIIGNDIAEKIFSGMKIQFKSDLLRTKLLATEGGIWADASCLPVLPLRNWLPSDREFDFSAPHSPRIGRTVSNWFMIARPGSYLMSNQYTALCQYWRTPKHLLPQSPESIHEIEKNWRLFISKSYAHTFRIAPYFLWHYHFTRMLELDEHAADLFKSCPILVEHRKASFVHSFGKSFDEGKQKPLESLMQFLKTTDCPVQKINWRTTYNYPSTSMRNALIDRASETPTRVD